MSSRPMVFALVIGGLSLLFLVLAMAPWAKPHSLVRPAAPALEEAAGRHWSAGEIDRGRAFRSSGYARWFLHKGTVGLILLTLLSLGAHQALRRLPGSGTVPGQALALVVVFFGLELLSLPFGLAALDSARAFGISHQSTASWLWDWVRGAAIDLAITGLVGLVLFLLMSRLPRLWPVPATLLAGTGGIAMAFLVPILIDPIFNTFTPLSDPALSARFLDLARRGGVPAREVLVSDASRRTTAVNAYFTGFGPSRRIVIYDTLLQRLSPAEGELVLAHEIGHWARRHVTKGIVLGTLGLFVALLLGQAILARILARGWYGITGVLDPALIPLVVLLYWLGLFVELPIENAISRRWEGQADRSALELTGDAATQISTEVTLGRTNLSDVVPPPLVELLLFTHPAPLDRIGQAEAYGRAHPGAGAPPPETSP